ncbi:hypothetical protein PV646_33105 [Streptomyces sp. ID05-26A]|nr:hypothetical protein [Streptomyces sp. ID05-26A]
MTSMMVALRVQVRRTVRQSVRRSLSTAVPAIPRGQDWFQWAHRGQWVDSLTLHVIPQFLAQIVAPAWLPSWLQQPSQTGNSTPVGNSTQTGGPAGGSDKPAADESRHLSVETLVKMMIRERGMYLVHRTFNQAVGELWKGTVIDASYPAGTLDPNAPPGIYVIPGVVGVEYGDWCVIFKTGATAHYFGSVAVTAGTKNVNKEEKVCIHDIPTSDAHGWCTVKEVKEAKRQYDAYKKSTDASQ